MQKVEAAANDGDSIDFIRKLLRCAVLFIPIVWVVDQRLPLHIESHYSVDESVLCCFSDAPTVTYPSTRQLAQVLLLYQCDIQGCFNAGRDGESGRETRCGMEMILHMEWIALGLTPASGLGMAASRFAPCFKLLTYKNLHAQYIVPLVLRNVHSY